MPRKPKSQENQPNDIHKRHHALALCMGYNELAKLSQTLEEKSYYRLMRDNFVKDFVALGGNSDLFAKEPGVCQIVMPDGPPHIIFLERDIELMREAIRKFDEPKKKPEKRKRSGTKP